MHVKGNAIDNFYKICSLKTILLKVLSCLFMRNIVFLHLIWISVVNLKSNPGEIFREESNIPNPLKADCTLTLSDDDMESLVTSPLTSNYVEKK